MSLSRIVSAFTLGGANGSTTCTRTKCSTISKSPTTTLPSHSGINKRRPLSSFKATNSNANDAAISQTPLCDLQTFLRLCDLVQSGGEAKTVIQNSECLLNGEVETRRGKKLFPGDKVSFGNVEDLDVATEVKKKGYVYKPKVKKVKPLPKVDEDGNLEFGGRYRSEEWRAERLLKKADRKRKNQGLR